MDPELQQAIAMINAQIGQGNLQLNRDIYENIQLPTYRDVTFPTSVGQNTGFLPQNYAGGFGGMPTFGAMTGTAGMFGMAGSDPRWAMLGYQPGQETLGGRTLGGGEARSDTDMTMQYGAPVVGGTLVPDWMKPFQAQAQLYARNNQGMAPTQEALQGQVVGGITGALDRLRADPVYQQADGARRVQLEAQAVATATGMSVQNAASMVQDLRAQSAQNGGRMSSEQEVMDAAGRWMSPSDPAAAVNQAMSRLRADPSYQALDGAGRVQREAQAVAQATGMPLENATRAVAEFRSGTGASGGLTGNEGVDRIIQRNMPQGASLGPTGQQAAPLYGQQAQPQALPGGGELMRDPEMVAYQKMAGAPAQSGYGYAPGQLGGVNFQGSNAVGARANEAMSPAMRALYEQSRQFDVSSQLGQRGQDVTTRGQDITSQLGNRGYDVTMRGQDFGREANQNQSALSALQIESQLRADPFALERYRRGLSSTGIPNVIEAVAGRGTLPGVQASYGRPQAPGLQEAYGALTGGGDRMSGAGMEMQQRRAGAPTFGAPLQGQMASAQQQMAALPQLNKINARNYLRAGQGGQNYVNSAYKAAGMAGDDQDVQEAVRRGLPQFARGRMPTFGRVA